MFTRVLFSLVQGVWKERCSKSTSCQTEKTRTSAFTLRSRYGRSTQQETGRGMKMTSLLSFQVTTFLSPSFVCKLEITTLRFWRGRGITRLRASMYPHLKTSPVRPFLPDTAKFAEQWFCFPNSESLPPACRALPGHPPDVQEPPVCSARAGLRRGEPLRRRQR